MLLLLKAIGRWFTRGNLGQRGHRRAPVEVIFLRSLGLVYLALFIVATVTTHPQPGLHGRGLAVLAAGIALVAGAILVVAPQRRDVPPWGNVAMLLTVTASSAVLAYLQPKGIWQAGPYFVGIIAAVRLQRALGVLVLAIALAATGVVAAAAGHGGAAVSVLLGAVPWFFVMRLIARLRDEQAALQASQAAEARSAAAAERGRLAREMHDVLAHSLSALALQLESSRLLARDRGADADVVRALDRAHHLAASGLEEARRAIAAARGEELPGPERLEALTAAFTEQSGLPVKLTVDGEPRELAPDVRLAIYRTAQEALTNIRRHATPESVEVELSYRDEETILAVEDRGAADVPPPASPAQSNGGGYGLAGMRERAELLGGHLVAEPTASGFRVELSLPASPAISASAR
jgi:signal transduction histidine kinase